MQIPLIAAVVAMLACTVGETRPRPPAPDEEGRPEAVEEPRAEPTPLDTAAAGADDYRPMDLLVQSQEAYDAANVDESLTLAEQVLSEYPASDAAARSRWVGARAAFALGRYDRARELALAYAEGEPGGSALAEEARELARLAEDGMAEPAAAPPRVGAILPRSGPRALVRYGDMLMEGLELAVSEAERRQGRPIELVVVDDGGGSRTRQAVAELERRGALAIIGPLLPQQLPEAAEARQEARMVLISPTASGAPEWPETFSIATGDTRGAQELGQFAGDVGLGLAAVLYSRDPAHELKARAFAVEYEMLGGEVRAMVPYDSGTTTFGPHMNRILAAVGPRRSSRYVDGATVDSLVSYGLVSDRAAADGLSMDSLRALVRLIRPVEPGGVRPRSRPRWRSTGWTPPASRSSATRRGRTRRYAAWCRPGTWRA